MALQLVYPVPSTRILTQTYAQHVARQLPNYNGGIDWAIRVGTPVVAAAPGTVTVARNDTTGYGTHVRIQHADGYLTIYAHLSELGVQVGDTVKAGTIIGLSGNTGNSSGPHLHFELRKGSKAIDPAPFLLYATPEPEPTPEPVDIQPGDVVTVSGYGVRIRTSPEMSDNILGVSNYGASVTVADVSGDWVQTIVYLHRDWVRR